MPTHKPSGRTTTLAGLLAGGVPAPTIAVAEPGLGVAASRVDWQPPPALRLAPAGDAGTELRRTTAPPDLKLLSGLDGS
ncbi:MAG: hypothetical protein VX265_17415 [Myxococcota bacterium]|nr:hypothetical protein [Myxococcota bacterium]